MSLSSSFLSALSYVTRRELEAMRQGAHETVTSFISHWREKVIQMIDRPSEKEQISMIMRSLQLMLDILWGY